METVVARWVALILAAAFVGISGINDGGNLVGTFLATRGVPARILIPLLVAAIGLGPLVFGTRVAGTIAVSIVDFPRLNAAILDVALVAALATLALSWWLGLPTSTTPALAGGMVGAAWAAGDGRFIHWAAVGRVGAGLVGSVVVGFALSYALTRLVRRLLRGASRQAAKRWQTWQVVTVFAQGLAYGANDQEKAIGLAALTLGMDAGAGTGLNTIHVSLAAVALPLLVWAAGLFAGGWRIAATVSQRIVRLRPLAATEAEGAAALTVIGAALAGLPVSTTQTTSGSLLGLGAALGPRRVRWTTVRALVVVWATALPLAFALSAAVAGAARLALGW